MDKGWNLTDSQGGPTTTADTRQTRYQKDVGLLKFHPLSSGAHLLLLILTALTLPSCNQLSRQVAAGPGRLPNLVHVSEWLDTAGQPSRAQLAAMTRNDYRVVINLSPSNTADSVDQEALLLTAKGIAYTHIPVDANHPDPMDFELLSAMLDKWRSRSALVHCQLNMRASVLVFLYQVIREGADQQRAYENVTAVWVPQTPWPEFMAQVLSEHGMTLDP